MGTIRLSRVYDHEPKSPGKLYLVERLWPRGVRREDVDLDGWLKDVAPSTELRRWFSHDPMKWAEFRRRYTAELDAHPQAWQALIRQAHDVTLLYSSRDRDHNNAVALRDYLLARIAEQNDRQAKALMATAPHSSRRSGTQSGTSRIDAETCTRVWQPDR